MTHRLRLPPNPPPPAEVRGRAVALSGRPGGCERAGGCAPGRADPTAAHSHPSPLPTGRWVPRSCPRRQRGGGGGSGTPPHTKRGPRQGRCLPSPDQGRRFTAAEPPPRSADSSAEPAPLIPSFVAGAARRGLAEALPPAALPAVPPYPLAARRGAEPEPPQAAAPGRRPPCHSLGGRGGAQPGRRELGGRPGLAEEDAGGGGGGGGWGRQRGPLPPPGRRRRLRVLRGHGRALRPARTKGAARGRPAPKSSWLADPAAAGSRVGGWKGSADAPPGCPQPLALVPSKKKKKRNNREVHLLLG